MNHKAFICNFTCDKCNITMFEKTCNILTSKTRDYYCCNTCLQIALDSKFTRVEIFNLIKLFIQKESICFDCESKIVKDGYDVCSECMN